MQQIKILRNFFIELHRWHGNDDELELKTIKTKLFYKKIQEICNMPYEKIREEVDKGVRSDYLTNNKPKRKTFLERAKILLGKILPKKHPEIKCMPVQELTATSFKGRYITEVVPLDMSARNETNVTETEREPDEHSE